MSLYRGYLEALDFPKLKRKEFDMINLDLNRQ